MNGAALLSPALYSTFEDSEDRGMEDVPEEEFPTPSASPSSIRGVSSTRKAASIRTLGRSSADGSSSASRRTLSTSSPALPGTPKEGGKSPRVAGTLQRVRSSPRLPHDTEVEAAPSTMLYWSKAPVFGVIPMRTMRAHTVTLVDTTAWLFGGCDDKECSRDIFCFDTGTLAIFHVTVMFLTVKVGM